MKIAINIAAVLIVLLSVAAGAAKIALVPEEAEFLRQFGFTNTYTIIFGALQVVGALLLAIPATRIPGSVITASAFAVSAALLFAAGNVTFAMVSLVPVILTCSIAYLRNL